jgi:YVTN family beta-propeller protein
MVMRTLSRFLPFVITLFVLSNGGGAAPFAYIANRWDPKVSVIDIPTNSLAATVSLPELITGVAVSPDGTRVYAVNSRHAFVIDATTHAVIATITIGTGLGANAMVAVNPAGTRVYVTNNGVQGLVNVIDAASNTVIATIPAGDAPTGVVVHPAGTRVYVANFAGQNVSVIDAGTNTLVGYIHLTQLGGGGPCGSQPYPFGIAVNPAGTRVYVANQNCMSAEGYWYVTALDTATNAVVADIAVGANRNPRGVAVSPDGSRLYVSNGAVVDTATNKMIGEFPGTSLNGIALNSDGTRAYLPLNEKDVRVVDTATLATMATVRVGGWPFAVGQFVGSGAPTPLPRNYQGQWWKAPAESESGWGINLAHQGDVLFATWFTYDLTGKAWWLTMTATKSADNVYAGTLYQTTGPAFSAVPFNPSLVTRTAVGIGTLTFTDANNGSFAYTVKGLTQTKVLTRQVFGPLPICVWNAQPDLTVATNYQDLWWAAPPGAEAGWGMNLTHQGDTIFATWFTYDTDGSPLWLSATMFDMQSTPPEYAGTLYRTTGPPFNAVPFDPNAVTRTPVGGLTLTFTDGNAVSYWYWVRLPGSPVVEQTKPITRQVFRAPGTLCQ